LLFFAFPATGAAPDALGIDFAGFGDVGAASFGASGGGLEAAFSARRSFACNFFVVVSTSLWNCPPGKGSVSAGHAIVSPPGKRRAMDTRKTQATNETATLVCQQNGYPAKQKCRHEKAPHRQLFSPSFNTKKRRGMRYSGEHCLITFSSFLLRLYSSARRNAQLISGRCQPALQLEVRMKTAEPNHTLVLLYIFNSRHATRSMLESKPFLITFAAGQRQRNAYQG
jgi:hypothetical protein